MSGSASVPSGENCDSENDPIQDLIKEAESLMKDMPLENPTPDTETNIDSKCDDPLRFMSDKDKRTPSDNACKALLEGTSSITQIGSCKDPMAAMIQVGGQFSIDDDDDKNISTPREDEIKNKNNCGIRERVEVNNFHDDPLRVVNQTSFTASTQQDLEDHPLSNISLEEINENHSMPNSAVATPNISVSNAMSSIFHVNNGIGGVMNLNIGRGSGGSTETTVARMDTISKTTSTFASNLASIAQRGMAHVAAATSPAQSANVIGISHAHPQDLESDHYWSIKMKKNSSSNERSISNLRASVGSPSTGHTQLDKDQKMYLLKKHVGELLEGERIIMFVTNILHVSDTSGLNFISSQQQQRHISSGQSIVMWCCVMTYYRLILFSTDEEESVEIEPPSGWDRNCWKTAIPFRCRLIEVPLASMDRVENTVYQASGSSYMGLVIYGKDCGRVVRFTPPSYDDTGRVFESLNTYAFPGRRNLGYLFAFESKREEIQNSIKVDENSGQQTITLLPTPKRFDPMVEYPRLIKTTAISQPPWALWISVNSSYQLSQSYPSILVGPASLDEAKPENLSIIRQCSAFRKGQRLPIMTWCGAGGASIWRSSQPKVGLQGSRSPADELFVRHIIESARGANAMAEPSPIYPRCVLEQLTGDYAASSIGGKSDWIPEPGCGLKILDLRPRAAAIGNRTGGYGYENTSYYSNTTLKFCNIQNIHAVRDSYEKLCSLCNSKSTIDVQWHYLLEDTKWLSHVRSILAASWETAYWVHVWRIPILVHCSHGWDRTSQVACLSQLLLDSYYRTIKGFSILVEKDFMSFGHPFHLRSAHGEGRSDTKSTSHSTDEGQISPIFLQFLDCVYQLVELYPNAFEFNGKFLLELSFHVYSCRFGNMLCDTEREREALASIRQRTYSVWDYLEGKPEHRNVGYKESDGAMLMPLPMLLRNVRLWEARHMRYSPKPSKMIGLLN